MRDVLDRLKAQLISRLPGCAFDQSTVSVGKLLDLGELGAVASAVRDYMEAELIYSQAMQHAAAKEAS